MKNNKETGEIRNQNSEVRRQGPEPPVPEWWAVVPLGEKEVLRMLKRLLRSVGRGQSREATRAALKWELGIGCFIKTRLIHEWRRHQMRTTAKR